MTARGFVEGRRIGTPPAKISDSEIKAEDVRHDARREGLPRPPPRFAPGAWHQEGDGKAMIELGMLAALAAVFFVEIYWILR